ncbi:hypothetical protein TNCV_545101 [Trichonephila clavipes]|nr:hypothetical protein TNCV_545101 [Trichonephila clavipes]
MGDMWTDIVMESRYRLLPSRKLLPQLFQDVRLGIVQCSTIDCSHSLIGSSLNSPSAIRNRTTAHCSDPDASLHGTTFFSTNFLYHMEVSLLTIVCGAQFQPPFVSLFGGSALAAFLLTPSHIFTFHLCNSCCCCY